MIKRFAGLLRAAWVEYERDRARYLAVAMIYYAGVSLIPLLVLLLSGLGLLVGFWPTAVTAERQDRSTTTRSEVINRTPSSG